jgi:hypothetical protein
MANTSPIKFLESHTPTLIQTLEQYLRQSLSHEHASNFAWSTIEAWGELSISGKNPESSKEELFWAAIWALQHLADAEHWADGVTQRELAPLLNSLRTGLPIPEGVSAFRP